MDIRESIRERRKESPSTQRDVLVLIREEDTRSWVRKIKGTLDRVIKLIRVERVRVRTVR